jgi:transglutaminase-like putative cysteine protease
VPNSVSFLLGGLPQTFQKSDYRQSFQALEQGRVRVTVTAAPPTHKETVPFPLSDPQGGENLKDSLAMELDSPELRAAARSAVGGEKDAYAAAKRVAAWVGKHMVSDYGASSDSALDALRAMRGDCTEHSLLTVAMLRSLGIPARRIDGLIYVVAEGGAPRLYWHEWVEAFVGQWTQLDPTWEEPVADAAHIALGQEAREEILTLMGQLEVLDAR